MLFVADAVPRASVRGLFILGCAAAAAAAYGSSPIPQQYARNITVFHVNPAIYGVAPINMDTADALGDM